MKSIQFMKQPMMRKVLYALTPIVLAGIYFYGLRVLALILVVSFFGALAEWLFVRKTTKKITEAVLVTAILFTLTLPPGTPYFIAIIGIVFGVVFGKMVFGGFGKNPFNPALVGRAFIYVNFPKFLTVEWNAPATGILGGFTHYISPSVDAVSTATPMMLYRSTGETMPLVDAFLGNVSGSIGETSALLIILAGLYLIYTKTAAKETMISVLLGFLGMNSLLYFLGFTQVPPPLYGLITGGILFGAVFMATDPISSPKTFEGKVIYGLLIGIITVIIRGFALFSGGFMFAVLIGNTFAPIIDEAVKGVKSLRKPSVSKEAKHG